MIREIQLLGIVINGLMALALALWLPLKTIVDPVANRSRWLMTVALGLLGVQFLIQYVSGLRQMSVPHAVELNLLFFIPCSCLLSLCMLNLQRQGRISRSNWLVGGEYMSSCWHCSDGRC